MGGVFLAAQFDALADRALANAIVAGGDQGLEQVDRRPHVADPDVFRGDAALGVEIVVVRERDRNAAAAVPGGLQGAGFTGAGVKQAALDGGAMGSSISGAGPSVFAWFEDRPSAERAAIAMAAAFATAGWSSDSHVSPINAAAAQVMP